MHTISRLGVASVLGGLLASVSLGAMASDIRFTFGEYSAKTKPFWAQVAADFEAANPDIHIKVESIPWSSYLQTLTTDISADNAPDISVVASIWLTDFAEQGLVEPIKDATNAGLSDKIIPALLSPSVVDGELMGLPFAASARAMMINNALYTKAGVKPPTTWEELSAAAKKITELGGDTYGFGLPGKEEEVDVYYYYALWSHGGEIFDKDGKSLLGSPEAIAAAKIYADLVKAGYTEPSPTANSREDVFNLFKRGKIGTIFTFPMLVPQIAEEAPDLDYSVLPFPVKSTEAAMAITDALVVFKSSQAKEDIKKFLDFIYQDKYRSAFDKADGLLPVTQNVLQEDYFQKDPKIAAFANGLKHAKFQPSVKLWDQVIDITRSALQRVYTGDQTPEEALPAAAAAINALYGK
ncbi:MAG: sugar ABC transporter substrate-binding protein [Devosia sp.]